MRSPFPSAHTFWAYTVVELLIALTLSLILFIGVTELFSRVSGTMSETRATLNLSANLDGVELLLRQDLARIPRALTKKPTEIAAGATERVEDLGYLEIVEGPDTLLSHPYVDEKGNKDATVGDVDDILAFTAKADPATPFRGLIDGVIAERDYAEIIWFVRGNTLYRRVRLIDDQSPTLDPTVNTMRNIDQRNRRFGHLESDPFPSSLYYDQYSNLTAQYYLRMPTLEETLSETWSLLDWRESLATFVSNPNPDLWEQPHFFPNNQDRKSGSLEKYVSVPRHHRAGEDIVLTNVLSFDIKVWCPTTRNFVDLGAPGTTWESSNQPMLPRTWDSWSVEGVYKDTQPPYIESLEAIHVTIRCFDPASRILKQVTVVHQF